MLQDFFMFIAKELEGAEKKKSLFGISIDDPSYMRIENLFFTGDEAILNRTLLTWYDYKYKESKADKVPAPLNYYYFDFWLKAQKSAVVNLQKTINKINHAGLETNGVFNLQTSIAVKELKPKDICACISYYNIKRRFFHLHSTQREYRCSWMHRTLKLESYILNHVVLKND